MFLKKYLVILPGIILAFVLYSLSQGFNNIIGIEILGYSKSPISTAMIAILLGIFFGNFFKIRESFQKGLDFSKEYILKLGIICLGIQLKPFEFIEFGKIVNDFQDLEINSIELNHPGNCSGYSITSEEKKFCYLLDNEYESNQKKELIEFCNFSDTIIWDGMFLDKELPDKKGWGHSSVEQGIDLANEIEFKKFLISHHSPTREDNEITQIQNNLSNIKIKFASENEVIDF